MTASAGATLSVQQLTKEFTTPEGSTFVALNGVDLEIRTGEFFVLLGPSGCGKTTLLRSIAGLEQPTSGEIWLGEHRIDQLPPYRRRVNTVFQAYALFPHLTVRANIAFGLEMEGKKAKSPEVVARVDEMLELVGLQDFGSRLPSQLSGGQQQRVALARALAKRPDVLLLDEPLSALDLKLRREMQTELKRIQVESGITFVFVTHDQEEAMSMGDRIAVFQRGEIAQLGAPRDLYAEPANRFVAEFIGEMNFLSVTPEPGGLRTLAGALIHDAALSAPLAGAGATTVGIRPEHLAIAADGPLNGTIAAAQYIGTDLRLCLDIGGGDEVWVRVAASYDGPTAVGEPAALAVTPGGAREVVA
ncbi:ABC transporter ATP-binding protein [Leucobacter luti]|uniref:Spermidine/putrescine transport system ATP-binding protein n=1 Tax=Leucobacter luti TaxID=340320 RepID=A0A4Q7TQA9_9MICO|nr:ABC transporter ATP-binding protein [Leucobacter luti]MBL3699929.1 ABC transporter ATP-binding protein [Leucobacter luti]RZT62753.1 spermidine/putrescine transport system ATP-binding protein [Leucobacter luti]